MEITSREIEGIPPGNLRVPRGDFVAVWSAAERSLEKLKRQGKGDWYLAGVVVTCRWIAMSRPGVSGDFIRWKDEVHVTSVVLFARDP